MVLYTATAEAMNAQYRHNMEDRAVFYQPGTWGVKEPELSKSLTFLGVYDGHGGRDIVDFLEHGLSFHVARELSRDDNDSVDIVTRLKRAFLMTDIHSRKIGLLRSGSTVATCLVQTYPENPNQLRIVTANVGDARAVLFHNGVTQRLSRDHKPTDPYEEARIRRVGGFILRRRVMGVLAVTRSIGDHCLKEFVIAEPSVRETIIQKDPQHSSSFLILACDGLWDVMSDEEAVQFVHNSPLENKDDIVSALVQEAIRRGTTDNVTVLITWLLQ